MTCILPRAALALLRMLVSMTCPAQGFCSYGNTRRTRKSGSCAAVWFKDVEMLCVRRSSARLALCSIKRSVTSSARSSGGWSSSLQNL
jgi:hypothetical protein